MTQDSRTLGKCPLCDQFRQLTVQHIRMVRELSDYRLMICRPCHDIVTRYEDQILMAQRHLQRGRGQPPQRPRPPRQEPRRQGRGRERRRRERRPRGHPPAQPVTRPVERPEPSVPAATDSEASGSDSSGTA